jgi:hypothetical protein
MKKLILLFIALLAVRMAGRALRRQSEVTQLLWVLIGMTATASTTGTAKSRSTEARLNGLIPVVFPNTGGTISGSVNVTGNHNVGGSLNGPGGSGTLSIGTPAHVNGNGMTVDGTLTTHNTLSADGSLSVGGNASVSGNHSVGGSLTGGGGGTLTIGSPAHVSGNGMTVDGALNSHGTVTADGNVSAGGNVTASGTVNCGVLFVNGQRIAPGQGRPVFYPAPVADNVPTHGIIAALNEIVGCLIAAGISG